jgi:hypothetical protein
VTDDQTPRDDQPTPAIERRLTDDERELIMQLAIWTIAEQTGVSDQAAADALDDLIEREGLFHVGDAHDAYIKTGKYGHTIVHATREWLAFYAHSGQPLTRDDLNKYGRQIKPDDEAN